MMTTLNLLFHYQCMLKRCLSFNYRSDIAWCPREWDEDCSNEDSCHNLMDVALLHLNEKLLRN